MRPVLSHDPLSQHYNLIVNNSKMIQEVISVYSGIHIRFGSRLVHYTDKVCLPGSSTWTNAWKSVMAVVHAMLSVEPDMIVGSLLLR